MELTSEQIDKVKACLNTMSLCAKMYSDAATALENLDIGIEIIDPFVKSFGPPNHSSEAITAHVFTGIGTLADIAGAELTQAEDWQGKKFNRIVGFDFNGIFFIEITDKWKGD